MNFHKLKKNLYKTQIFTIFKRQWWFTDGSIIISVCLSTLTLCDCWQ